MTSGAETAIAPIETTTPGDAPRPRRTLLAAAILAALTLAIFEDVLFTRGDAVLSRLGCDLSGQYVAWRQFAFSELRRGNLPLWNPHVYCGAPFFGGFQSGLLYPLNAPYLFLPLAKAINLGIALHVFLAGFFMYLWARQRGLAFAACLLSAAVWMFCGPQFAHVVPGHLTGLISTAWIPLVFLSLDGFIERRAPGWLLAGAAAVAMMLLGGDPQYVFYTAVAAAIYCALRLRKAQRRGRLVLGLAAMCAGAAALAAVQLWTGLDATSDSVRGAGGVPFRFAAMFSFPPENFLTFLAPGFFGDAQGLTYWGRCYWWEMCLFIGVTGFLLAAYGAAAGRGRRFALALALLLLLLALGAHTPLFRLLYDWAPGFSRFRGMSKFIVQAAAFLALLSGMGLDRLIRAERPDRRLALVPIGLAAALIAGSVWLGAAAPAAGPAPFWQRAMRAVRDTRESQQPPALYDDAAFARRAQLHAAASLFWAAVPCGLAAAVLLLLRSPRRAAAALCCLAVGELLLFAASNRPTFDLEDCRPAFLEEFLRAHPGDYRVMVADNPDAPMLFGADDLWGYAPLFPARYGEFMAASQGEDPNEATPYVVFRTHPPIYRMLRCRYVIMIDGGSPWVREAAGAMPRVALLSDYRVLAGRDRILQALGDPSFDPARTVILESPPDFGPPAVGGGTSAAPAGARLLQSSTDSLVIEADVERPAILLVTDNYARGWRATGLPGSSRSRYRILPANYTLRAVPLAAGHHRILMDYSPRGFRIGRWISAAAAAAFLGVAAWLLLARRS